jgi:hypothetical protein
VVAYVSCRMRRLASERGKRVRNRPGGGGKCVENRKKILNRGNEPKNMLKAKELTFSGAQNELVFERKKAQSKRKMGAKIGELLRSFVVPIRSGLLCRNSTHYSFPLSSLGRACLVRPRPATNPSPGPRRLMKAPSRSTLSPWRGQTHFAMRSVSDTTESVLRLPSLRMTMERGCQFLVSNFYFLVFSASLIL